MSLETNRADITIYTTLTCPYCHAAKSLLNARGLEYQEIDVTSNQDLRRHLVEETGMRTVPQIFIGKQHVGGFEDLRNHLAKSA